MSRNIIICCDGTNNEFGTENTNVVRLIQALDRDPLRQRIYYDPGVGTLPEPGFVSGVGQRFSLIVGLAFGAGLLRKVGLAYEFLMREWRPGDRVFLFGFSRGAYTVRVLAGLLYMYGLLPAGNENLIPYVLRAFKASRRSLRKGTSRAAFWNLSNEFRRTFAQPVAPGRRDRRFQIHFMGVWDTVSSVGWLWEPARYPHTWSNPGVKIVRHAVSLDERRAFFRQNLFKPVAGSGRQDLLELWFPGVHADVGGGYPESEGGLWREPFQWMLEEAKAHGLLTESSRELAVLTRSKQPEKPWCEPAHESLSWKWRPAEVFPKLSYGGPQWRRRLRLNLGRPRQIREKILLHPTVVQRQEELGAAYRPRALEGIDRGLIDIWRRSDESMSYGHEYDVSFVGGRTEVRDVDLYLGDEVVQADRTVVVADDAADLIQEVAMPAPSILLESAGADLVTPPVPAPQGDRYLQVQLSQDKGDGDFSEPLRVLKPGLCYLARVQVGAKSDDYFDPGQALQLSEFGLFDVYFHDLGAGRGLKGHIVIAKQGTSTPCFFPFEVPVDAKRFDARLVLSRQGRIVQAVLLNATPNASGELEIVLTVDVAAPLVNDASATFDAALMLDRLSNDEMAGLLSTYTAAAKENKASEGKVIRVGQATLNAVVAGVANAIREHANKEPSSVALDSPLTEQLLCKLAIHGSTLFEDVLRPAGLAEARPSHWRLSIACSAESYFPAELVYDRPVPLPGARLCQSFRDALETGVCCKEHEQRGGQVVCPLGFWGLSCVIERKCAAGIVPSPDEFRLMFRAATFAEGLRLGPALLGVSDRVNCVDAGVSTQLTTAITERYHRNSAVVTNWNEWQAAIVAHKPGVLVLLPHHLTDESLLEYLQIGVQAKQNFFGHPNYLNSRHVTPEHVLAARDGAPPIVLLIGCDTAKARVAFENFVVAFERAGAAGVVGTTAPIIGRHAGPAVEQLLLSLRNKCGTGRPLGDVLLDAKRKIMLAGYPMVMCLASYGGVDHVLQCEATELEVN